MLQEARVGREVIVLAMLQDKQSLRCQQFAGQDAVRQFGQLLQGIRWVGKNEVERLSVFLDEAQSIATQCSYRLVAQRLKHATQEREMLAVALHTHHLRAAARKQFERNASRPGKEIKRTRLLKIEVGAKHVEEVFFGKIGGGTCLKRARHFEVFTFVFSGDDSHWCKI